MYRSHRNKKRGYTDKDAVAMTTLDGDERSPNGTTNLFDVTMDDESATGGGGGLRLIHIHKNDDEPMVSVCDNDHGRAGCRV